MKFSISIAPVVLLACVLEFATSFTPSPPQSNGGASPSRVNGIDPDALQHLADGIDAARVLFLDCDQGECSMVEGTHDPDGWHFENRLGGVYESKNPAHTSKILMMEMEDTE